MMRASSSRAGIAASMPSAIFSSTVIASNSEKCWNTMPMPSIRAAFGFGTTIGVPFQTISPASGCMTP